MANRCISSSSVGRAAHGLGGGRRFESGLVPSLLLTLAVARFSLDAKMKTTQIECENLKDSLFKLF
jgi:hypothetical protein